MAQTSQTEVSQQKPEVPPAQQPDSAEPKPGAPAEEKASGEAAQSSNPPSSTAVMNLLELLRRPSTEPVDVAEATQALALALQSLDASRSNPAKALQELLRAADDFQSARESLVEARERRHDAYRRELARQQFVLRLVAAGVAVLLMMGGFVLVMKQPTETGLRVWLFCCCAMLLALLLMTLGSGARATQPEAARSGKEKGA